MLSNSSGAAAWFSCTNKALIAEGKPGYQYEPVPGATMLASIENPCSSRGYWGRAKSDDEAGTITVFVDSGKGDDSGPGTQQRPLRTLTAARDHVRAQRSSATPTQNATVWLRAGTFDLSQSGPLVLDARDSNTTWSAWSTEAVMLSAGFHVPKAQWTAVSGPALETVPSTAAQRIRQAS